MDRALLARVKARLDAERVALMDLHNNAADAGKVGALDQRMAQATAR